MKKLNKKEKRVVARWTDEAGVHHYAYRGRETGMGRTIESTTSLEAAEDFGSPSGIMSRLGGHYSGYEPIEVLVKIEYTIGKTLKFPDPSTIWD